MASKDLTLIVAATRNMGIGLHGSMPWSGLRKEMQYFARVTTRVPPTAPSGSVNAVIMGRKTWDSIPKKFRPLKNRLNIIITRSAPSPPPSTLPPVSEPVRVSSLEQALSLVAQAQSVARVFVMGGAQIYDAALKREESRRVLLTSIEREFECDTFFPVDLGQSEDWTRKERADLEQWTGETIQEGGQEEAGTKYEFQLWERN